MRYDGDDGKLYEKGVVNERRNFHACHSWSGIEGEASSPRFLDFIKVLAG